MWTFLRQRLQQYGWPGQIYYQQAWLGAPALLLVLLLAAEWDDKAVMVMAGAAFSTAFGAAHALGRFRWGAMTAACAGMALAGVIGSLIGGHGLPAFAVAALLTAVCAALSSYNSSWWWVTLQTVCAYLIAGYYPSDWQAALQRGGLMLAGGGIQILFTALTARFFVRHSPPLPAKPAQRLSANVLWRFSLAAAVAVTAALWMARHIGLSNDYWAAIAAVMILRPEAAATVSRSLHRMVGTVAGCALATLTVYLLHDSLPLMMLATTVSAATALAVQRAQYALLTAAISATIVFLFAIGHGDPLAATEHRIEATLLGGATALVSGWLFGILGHNEKDRDSGQ